MKIKLLLLIVLMILTGCNRCEKDCLGDANYDACMEMCEAD